MARAGLNATLQWSDGGAPHAYRVRCDMVSHGVQMVYEESQARRRKAFYPHRLAESQFSINVVLIGGKERAHFNAWIKNYASFVLKPELSGADFPPMQVIVPSRNFDKRGVLISGYDYGDKLGAMVWNHVLVFEATPSVSETHSEWTAQSSSDTALQYFYPMSEQLSGTQSPQTNYNNILTAATNAPENNPGGSTWESQVPDGTAAPTPQQNTAGPTQ